MNTTGKGQDSHEYCGNGQDSHEYSRNKQDCHEYFGNKQDFLDFVLRKNEFALGDLPHSTQNLNSCNDVICFRGWKTIWGGSH